MSDRTMWLRKPIYDRDSRRPSRRDFSVAMTPDSMTHKPGYDGARTAGLHKARRSTRVRDREITCHPSNGRGQRSTCYQRSDKCRGVPLYPRTFLHHGPRIRDISLLYFILGSQARIIRVYKAHVRCQVPSDCEIVSLSTRIKQ